MLSIPPSDDSIQVMLNKNAELLLNLQLSQYERYAHSLSFPLSILTLTHTQ